MNQSTTIPELHATFCRITGQQLRLGIGEYNREIAWARFVQAGFTVADLTLVLNHLLRGIAKGDRRSGCLRFSTLIECLDHFDEECVLAKAEIRNRVLPPTPKKTALAQLRPCVTESTNSSEPQHVSVAAQKALAQLQEWKKATFER